MMMSICKFLKRAARPLAGVLLLAAGCGEAEADESSRKDAKARGDAEAGGTSEGAGSTDAGVEDAAPEGEPLYVWHSFFFGTEDTTAYVQLLDSLEPQTIDYGEAREFAGYADVWVHEGSIFVSDPESLSITKFHVRDRALVQGERISFAAYGITELGFWLNKFVSSTKAYLLNGPHEYIVWNPETMEIRGTLPLPELAQRAGFKPYPGYSDRSAILRGSRLYQPLYWTDDDYFRFTPDSRIAVIDTERDEVVDVLEAPTAHVVVIGADQSALVGNSVQDVGKHAAGAREQLAAVERGVARRPASVCEVGLTTCIARIEPGQPL
jgi:hypothetical protein